MTAWVGRAKTRVLEAVIFLRSPVGRATRSRDLDGLPRCEPADDRDHIAAALDWICAAQDAGDDDGVAAMYSFVQGWIGSYPETTGYIIPTMFDAARFMDEPDYAARASRMAEWVLTQQFDNGAFPGSFKGSQGPPRVFNTGQVLLGLLAAARELEDERYLDAARRAGDWLVSVQDDDGCWRRFTFNDIPHTYNVRVAWAVGLLGKASGDERYVEAALKNATWARSQQQPGGWLANNEFYETDTAPLLHTISYSLRGLVELGMLTGRSELVEASAEGANGLKRVWREMGRIPGTSRSDWSSDASWRCLPGEAQLSIVWLELARATGDDSFETAANELLDSTKAMHFTRETDPALRGGVSGSYPVNAPYERYCLVNWGPKFLIDALILRNTP